MDTLVREGVVTEFTGGTEPVYSIGRDKHVEAAFYRNNVVHHFVTRAIIELALVHAAEGGFAEAAMTPIVWEEALALRDVAHHEERAFVVPAIGTRSAGIALGGSF